MSQPVAPPDVIPMTPVVSDNLAAIGYDAPSQCLQIGFKSGAIWRYHTVPASEHTALMSAPSKGSHFHRHIKSRYPAEPVKK